MSKNVIFKLIIVLIVYCGHYKMNAQKNFEISPYAGIGFPQSDFKNLSDKGFDVGISLDKFFREKFGVGLDFNYQKNPFQNPSIYERIPSNIQINSINNGAFDNMNITFGPSYKLGKDKFNVMLFLRAGLSLFKNPMVSNSLVVGTGNEIPIMQMTEGRNTSFGMTTGARLNYKINDKLDLFFQPQLIYSSAKINYVSKDLNTAFYVNPDTGEEIFDWQSLVESPFQEQSFSPLIFNINAGITFKIGGKKKPEPQKNNDDLVESQKKVNIRLTSHNNRKKVRLTHKKNWEKIEWKAIDDKIEKIQNYKVTVKVDTNNGEQIIDEEIVQKPNFKFEGISRDNFDDRIDYTVEIVGLDRNNNQATNTTILQLFQSDDCFEAAIEMEMECDSIPYNQQTGWIQYRGYVFIKNTSDELVTLGNCNIAETGETPVPHSFPTVPIYTQGMANQFLYGIAYDISTPMNPGASNDWYYEFQPNPPISQVVAPGQTVTYSINLYFRRVPTEVKFYGALYAPNIGEFARDKTILLLNEHYDDCLCKPCADFEDGAKNQVNINSITVDPAYHPFHSVLEIDQNITSGTLDVSTLKAELIYFEEILPNDYATDPQFFELDHSTASFPVKHFCQICNQTIDGLGIFNGVQQVNGSNASRPTTRTAKWYFITPLDMNAGVNSKLRIGVPRINPLDCCNKEYKFSIRYTFENEECKKCELVVDYHFQP